MSNFSMSVSTFDVDLPSIQLKSYFFNDTPGNGSGESVSNLTRDSNQDIERLYDVPGGLVALLSVFYGSISVLAVVGNSLVMWIVATSRRMQNVTNCFIANLALADIVIGLFAIPFQFQAALLQRWNLPEFMCPFCPFVQVLSVSVSVFTLTAIAVDRHRAILNPLSARPSKRIAKIIIGGIWLLALGIATPMAVTLRVSMVEDEHGLMKPFCQTLDFSEHSMFIYRMVLLFLQYLTPLCVISFVYARMAYKLWGTRAPGNAQDSRDANLMRNKKKVIKMLVIVVALFALCWLPLQTYQVLQTCFPDINEYRYINIVFFCCDWLAMSNSCYNPFIYGIYNEKFKREFKQRFPCGRRSWQQTLPSDSFDMDKNHSINHTRQTSLRSSGDWRRSTRHSTYLGGNNANQHQNTSRNHYTHQSFHGRRPTPSNNQFPTPNDQTNNNMKKKNKHNITFCLNSDRNCRPRGRSFNGSVPSSDLGSRSAAGYLSDGSSSEMDGGATEMLMFPNSPDAFNLRKLDDIDEFTT